MGISRVVGRVSRSANAVGVSVCADCQSANPRAVCGGTQVAAELNKCSISERKYYRITAVRSGPRTNGVLRGPY